MRSATSCVRGIAQLFVAGVLLTLSAGALSASSVVTERSKAAGLDACVEETPVMRRNHMEFLKHQRDKTVHNGIRGAKHSLAGCVDCHASTDASGTPAPVNGEGQFCQTCHSYAAVSIDCFQCHRTIPREQAASAAHGLPAVGALELTDPGGGAALTWTPAAPGTVVSDALTVNRRD
jgi:hypothetical protein